MNSSVWLCRLTYQLYMYIFLLLMLHTDNQCVCFTNKFEVFCLKHFTLYRINVETLTGCLAIQTEEI